jgi:hypothetical protein
MSRDDLDRALRTWLEPGAERAPERFVWQALDQVESTPQRHPWVTRLADSGRTLRPVLRPLATAAVVAVAAVMVATVVTQQVGQPAEPPRAYTTEDLAPIVVWEDTKPASWTLDELVTNAGAALTLPVRTMTPAQFEDLAALRGYLGGRYTNFSGPDTVFTSWAVVFETAADADRSLPVFANEMAASDGWGLGPGEPVDLGAEGLVFTGETRSLMGAPSGDPVPMRLYLWRRGNMLLALGGWFDYDAEELRRVAEAMDARAR